MDALEFELSLIPAQDDPPLGSPEYQAELRNFEQDLESNGLEVSPIVEFREAWIPEPIVAPYLGDFIIKLAAIVGPVLGAGVGAWLRGRYGRKVRIKVGANEIEAEAQTVEEVERLIARAYEIQQRTRPKAIHEP
jgi:hypothetical protein